MAQNEKNDTQQEYFWHLNTQPEGVHGWGEKGGSKGRHIPTDSDRSATPPGKLATIGWTAKINWWVYFENSAFINTPWSFLLAKWTLNNCPLFHYSDVIMSSMTSQITGVSVVFSTVCLGETPKLRVTGLCDGKSPVIGEFPAQRASNAENVSIWWRHHV